MNRSSVQFRPVAYLLFRRFHRYIKGLQPKGSNDLIPGKSGHFRQIPKKWCILGNRLGNRFGATKETGISRKVSDPEFSAASITGPLLPDLFVDVDQFALQVGIAEEVSARAEEIVGSEAITK